MIARTSNPWKKWGIVGFLSIGAIYAGIAFFSPISYVSNFGLYLNLGITAGAGITGCAIGSALATIKYNCQRIKINNQDLMKSLINSDSVQQSSVFSSHAMMEQVFQASHEHAAFCENLVNDFHRELVAYEVDVNEYIKEANELKREYIKRHPADKDQYLEVLKQNGYSFAHEPAKIFSQDNKIQYNPSLAIQISPSRSPALSPTTRLFNSQPIDIKHLLNTPTHQTIKSI